MLIGMLHALASFVLEILHDAPISKHSCNTMWKPYFVFFLEFIKHYFTTNEHSLSITCVFGLTPLLLRNLCIYWVVLSCSIAVFVLRGCASVAFESLAWIIIKHLFPFLEAIGNRPVGSLHILLVRFTVFMQNSFSLDSVSTSSVALLSFVTF